MAETEERKEWEAKFDCHYVPKRAADHVPADCGEADWCWASDDWKNVTCPKCLERKPAYIVIEVRGGLVHEVRSDKEVEVEVFDWDNIEEEELEVQKETASSYDLALKKATTVVW